MAQNCNETEFTFLNKKRLSENEILNLLPERNNLNKFFFFFTNNIKFSSCCVLANESKIFRLFISEDKKLISIL